MKPVVKHRMKKLIIDVDAGVDDAIAIMMALSTPDVEVLGITCCYGNTSVENVLRNVLRVLKVCDRLDVSLCHAVREPFYTNMFVDMFLHPAYNTHTDSSVPWLLKAFGGP